MGSFLKVKKSYERQQKHHSSPGALQGSDSFHQATQVIQALAANGADIRADVYTENKTVVVHAAGQGA